MTTARDIMHAGAECIGENESLADAARKMRDMGVGSLPVCGEDQKLHGMITDRDIVIKCIAEGGDASQVRAAELAQGTPVWVDADTDLRDCLTKLEENQVKRMPVIENHRLVGMISESDLARNISDDQLAEFVQKVYARA